LGGAERGAAWTIVRAAHPSVREYEQVTTRVFPVFRLVPVQE
jgi:hypothetical protein